MRVRNPFTISYDPSSEQVDGSDWDFCLKTEDLPRDIFLRKYKESQIASLSSWSAEGNYPPGWMTSESVRVASYYYADYGKEKAYLLSDGSVVLKSILDGNMAKYGDNGLLRGVSVIKEREIPSRKIKWAKITAVEPLEQTDWPGKYIPIVPFIGNELVLDGKYIQYGVIRKVKETMKAMNYMVSSAVKSIGLMPKNPVYAPIETLTAFKDMYEVANKKSFAALPYLSYDKEGRSLPPPSRQPFEPAIQSFNQMVFLFQGLLKGSIGLYGPSLGEPSNETSGLAIQSRKIQGTQATFHLQANAERSMWHTGRILVDLIPKYYDHGQVVQIIGEDDKAAQVMLDRNIPESPQERENAAEENRYNIHVGRYDVEISVVPGAATRRQENLGRVSEILKTWPNLLPSVGHILFRNMDLDGAEEIANELLEMKKRNQGALPPQIQQQLAGMQKMIQALQQELRDAKIREAANIYEVESRERTELVKADLATAELRAKVATTIGQMESKESLALLDAKLRSIEEKIAELKKPAAVQLQQEQQPEEQPVS